MDDDAPELLIRAPDRPPETVKLTGTTVSLGRAHGNQLCYPEDASLSRQHLVLERDPRGWSVRDLNSKNHTYVNGNRVQTARLTPGDRITAGRLTMVFDDPRGEERTREVEFYVDSLADTPPLGTVMTNLGGVLSGEVSDPSTPRPAAGEAESSGTFRSPVVTALIRAGRELMGRQPLDELFKLILDLSIETVGAERGLLMTLEGDELVPRARRGEGFRIPSSARDRVIRDKASLLVRDTQRDQTFRDRLSISEQQIRTMMAVPLQTDERVIGLIYVDSRFFVRDFTPDDLSLLTVLANVAAIRIEHGRLAEVERAERQMVIELEQAATVQRQILPAAAPRVAGLDLAGHNAACRTVGGDYYDFLPYGEDRVGLVLGDVAGKGMPAALLMCGLQARVRVLAESPDGLDLAELMSRLDRSLADSCPDNRFITLFFGLLDARAGELRFCNAGHNPPILLRADGTVEHLPPGGTVLGILPGLPYEERRCRMEVGELLAIFSDGVTEALSPVEEEFGVERLADILLRHRGQPAARLIGAVTAALESWTVGAPAADDVTLVLARRTG
jgi:serine phosphatase RsbU (regulator of sigma subunit)/pSer/pThr/pTyr-binding forkhead associated (FHA) protein